jgi:hypothetical protein
MSARRASSALSSLEKAALYVALFSGLFAIFNDGREWYRDWNSRPEVTASATTPISMRYEPGTRSVTFSFGILLHNEGAKAESMRTAQAALTSLSDPKQRFDFSLPDITLKDGKATHPLRAPIGQDEAKQLTCEVSALLTDDLRAVISAKESRRSFELLLTGARKDQYAIRFDFDISPAVVTYVLDPKATTARTAEFTGSDLQLKP